ncbi:MAG: hypothetical protein ACFFBD_20930 [Candidatus Hodarchaeota archaeon]
MQKDPVDSNIKALKRKKNCGKIIGLLLMLSMIPIGLFALFSQPLDEFTQLIAVFSIMIPPLSGVLIFFYVGVSSGYMIRAAHLYQQIAPDQLVVTTKYVLAQKDDVYLLTLPNTRMMSVYLIRFKVLIDTDQKKILIPKIRLLTPSKDKIEDLGLRMVRREQTCTIPISENRYGTGEAVIYCIDTQADRGILDEIIMGEHYNAVRAMTSDPKVLLKVINVIKRETISSISF